MRLTFFDRTGRVVLRQVGGRPAAPRRLPSTDDPEPFAVELKPDRALYAPFTFEVGRERLVQWNAGLLDREPALRPPLGRGPPGHEGAVGTTVRRRP